MKKLSTLILILSLSLCAFAQGGTTVPRKGFVYYDLNGLCPGDKPTKYEYKDCYFTVCDDFGLDLFYSTNPNIPAFTKDVNNGIKPGDKVENVLQLDICHWEKSPFKDEASRKTGGEWYIFAPGEGSESECHVLEKMELC